MNPAATKGAYAGISGTLSGAGDPPSRIICHSICAFANSELHIREPGEFCLILKYMTIVIINK